MKWECYGIDGVSKEEFGFGATDGGSRDSSSCASTLYSGALAVYSRGMKDHS